MSKITPAVDIIIVDDDISMVMYLEELLVEKGYHLADSTHTGEDGLAMARKCHPALVLMDIKLGKGMDGISGAMILREELSIPCILLQGMMIDICSKGQNNATPSGIS